MLISECKQLNHNSDKVKLDFYRTIVIVFRLSILISLFLLAQKSFGQIDKKQGQLVLQNYQDTILVADVMPEFPGGIDSLYQFLRKNIVYPPIRGNVQGTNVVEFIIDSVGKVCAPKITIPLFPPMDEEVLRIVNLIPDWKPALHEGKSVSTYFVLPIKWSLGN